MEQTSLFEYWKLCWTERFARFEGRARRSEFWGFVLFNYVIFHVGFVLVLVLLGILLLLLGIYRPEMYNGEDPENWGILGGIGLAFLGLYLLFGAVSLIPFMAVFARRLHDAGYSAVWLLLWFVPMGYLALLVFACLDSQPGENKWGSNPKEIQWV